MSDSINIPSSFSFLNTVFILIDSYDQESLDMFLQGGYTQGVFLSFGEETIVLYKIFPDSEHAKIEQFSLDCLFRK